MLKLFIIKMFKNVTISRGLISYPLRPGDIYASVVIKAIIGSDNGLLPDWHQATTWIHDILSIRPWRTHFNDILFEIQKFSFKKMHLKTSSAKWHTFCLSLNVLMAYSTAELNDKKWVQFICILLTYCVTFLSVYTTHGMKTKEVFLYWKRKLACWWWPVLGQSSCYPLMLVKSLQFMEDQVPSLQTSGLNKWVGSSSIAPEMATRAAYPDIW